MKYFCTECGKELKPNKIVWLDLNVNTHEYREKPWPQEVSQGMFCFRKTCSKIILKNKGQLIKGLGIEK